MPNSDLQDDAKNIQNIIGDPFDWCEVPEGEFIYGEGDDEQKLSLPTFAIAKYPITYNQFQVFMKDEEGRYVADERWWDGLGHKRKDPSGKQKWKFRDHPRENVTWYDMMAFCRWLSWRIGGAYEIDNLAQWAVRLPTEFEWEKAARGTDGRLYPYGNTFDKDKANTLEAGMKQTTPVYKYSDGASPYGVMDMTGNTWEWCLSDYQNPQLDALHENIRSRFPRVLRGGSFSRGYEMSRAAYRHKLDNYLGAYAVGFRIMRPL